MTTPLLATKLFIPPPRAKAVLRPKLVAQLEEGIHPEEGVGRKISLISAPAGFGKTTLISEWVTRSARPVAWLSLDERDNDPTRFLGYLVAAIQMIEPGFGEGIAAALLSPQPPSIESILTHLLNEIARIPGHLVLVLDDLHVIDSQAIDHALTLLIEHLPSQIHLIIATREDPSLPLARLRARGQMTELRAADLRFSLAEAAGFLNEVMGLALSEADIAALESRTEGWIAGLQLAALAVQGTRSTWGQNQSSEFIKSFTGSHHYILDYLVEEVLHQQPEKVQAFLVQTSILDRMCGPLCEALLPEAATPAQDTLAYLEQANLFLVPLDTERRWYRYHHLFADLLRQRLLQDSAGKVSELHRRASRWYESNGLEVEAFLHAGAANDVENAARLVEGNGMPLQFRGAARPVINWLSSLPNEVMDDLPELWVTYASAFLVLGQIDGIEEKLRAAEAAMQAMELDESTRDLVGRIASMRATIAVAQHEADTILAQSQRALEYLHPGNVPVRTSIIWTSAYAHELHGDRLAARKAYTEAQATSRAIGHQIVHIMSTLGVGGMQEVDTQLSAAAETYREVLELTGDPPLPVACAAHLGLARIYYEWNDLEAAHKHAELSLPLAQQFQNRIDRVVSSEVFLARLKLTQGDVSGATALLSKTGQAVRQHNFVHRVPEVAAMQVLLHIRQGNLKAAFQLAEKNNLPISLARAHLAGGEPEKALAVLAPIRLHAAEREWADREIKVLVLQAIAFQANNDTETAVQVVGEALVLAQPGGFIRTFLDEGPAMAALLSEAAARGILPDYVAKIKAAFKAEAEKHQEIALPLLRADPLSQRELEILQLIAGGLSNQEIGDRLFLALNTVKGHNRKIFSKLQVQRRTEAVARARQLGLL